MYCCKVTLTQCQQFAGHSARSLRTSEMACVINACGHASVTIVAGTIFLFSLQFLFFIVYFSLLHFASTSLSSYVTLAFEVISPFNSLAQTTHQTYTIQVYIPMYNINLHIFSDLYYVWILFGATLDDDAFNVLAKCLH